MTRTRQDRSTQHATTAIIASAVIAVVGWAVEGRAESACGAPPSQEFRRPEPVVLQGYDGEAMEPFLARDGETLFFNNRNEPPERTDLHWATRIDATTFRYRGLVVGANSAALDGVPTMDASGRFCFVSTRSYRETLATVHCGRFTGGTVADLRAVPGLRSPRLGQLIFDVEVSADGAIMVFADGRFSGGPVPDSARLELAERRGDDYVRAPGAVLDALNRTGRNYAPALSRDACEIFFTRLTGFFPFYAATIWRAVRDAPGAAFAPPQRIDAIESFAEGPTASPDGRSLYYHARVGGKFRLFRVTR